MPKIPSKGKRKPAPRSKAAKTRAVRTPTSSRRAADGELGQDAPPAEEPASEEEAPPGSSPRPLTVVGIGASAGGLEALTEILRLLSETNGMAFVFIQHLAPRHVSMLPELLSNVSKIPVVQITGDTTLEPDRLHVIGPNTVVELNGRRFSVSARSDSPEQQNHPIDVFFRSLAATFQSQAIGIVLSGTGSDGATGLAEIKAAGGITIAQAPETARYDGMPRAAISMGAVDLVRAPELIAQELAQFGRHPYLRIVKARMGDPELVVSDDQLKRIFAVLKVASGIDFSQYKRPTVKRRLRRRMLLQKVNLPEHYIHFISENSAEAKALACDILITVTRFFRDADSYEAIKRLVFPAVIAASDRDTPIRIWIPGCSTGEEVYSIAISLLEYLSETTQDVRVQIFATDVSEEAVNLARAATYGENIVADVSVERLRRFFTKTDGAYRLQKSVRDMCVFARQDITRDPPFSKLDLIVCRNVLIYLDQPLQRRLMTIFHYALRPHGFLVLSSSETVGAQSNLFSLVDKKHKIYEKVVGSTSIPMEAPANRSADVTIHPRPHRHIEDDIDRVRIEAQDVLLSRYAPPGVVVDANYEIVRYHGHTGRYFEHPPGDPSRNIMKMAREGLLYALRTTLQEARRRQSEACHESVRVRTNGGYTDLRLRVIPIAREGHLLVLFEEIKRTGGEKVNRGSKATKTKRVLKREEGEVPHLRAELQANREYLQSIIQDVEAANEELQSANEEILSSNEELQSTNEELDTAKEELQSTNEELNTVNDELQARNEELSRVNGDLLNLLSSVQIAVVIVAADLRIRRYTPMAEKVLNLIPGDIGRPITHIKPNIDCPEIEHLIFEVIDTVSVRELEVKDRQGARFLLRIRPYKSVNNQIDGAVLALIDLDSSRQDRGHGVQVRDYAQQLVDLLEAPTAIITPDLRVKMASRAFLERFQIGREALIDQPMPIPELEKAIREASKSGFEPGQTEVEGFFGGKPGRLRLTTKKIDPADKRDGLVVLRIDDVS